jgi:hypothetical protein
VKEKRQVLCYEIAHTDRLQPGALERPWKKRQVSYDMWVLLTSATAVGKNPTRKTTFEEKFILSSPYKHFSVRYYLPL